MLFNELRESWLNMKQNQLPQGFRDDFGQGARKKELIMNYLADRLYNRGYTKITTPLLEYKNVFNTYNLEGKQNVYEFVDTANGNLVLRPDLTLPIARFLSTTNISLPQKFYYLGDVFTLHEKHRGSANQMTQAGIELVGYSSVKAEMECMWLISQINRELLGNNLYLELGDATFADTILDALSLAGEERKNLLKALFNKNIPSYESIIKAYKNSALYPFLAIWPRLFGSIEEVKAQLQGIILPLTGQRLIDSVLALAAQIAQIPGQEVRIDLSAQAPQDYYTGITFKGYVDDASEYIVSGGRYDRLLANFQEQAECAVGMGFDVDVLTQVAQYSFEAVDKVLVYYQEPGQWAQAMDLLKKNKNYSIALVDTVEEAQAMAKAEGARLVIID